MRNSFSWRHAVAFFVMVSLLSLVAGAALTQDEPVAEPSDAIVIPSADNVSQSMTVDQYAISSGVLAPQGMTATSLMPSGTYASEQIPSFNWTADLGDTEQFFFYLYEGMVTDGGKIVKGTTGIIDGQLVYPLTPTCAVSGSTADCSLTTTVQFEDGHAYYWFVTSEAIDEVTTPVWDDPSIVGFLSYDDAVSFNLDAVLPPNSGSRFEFWATAGDRVTAVATGNVGVQVTIEGPDSFGFVANATDAGDGSADGTATITNQLITETGRYFVRVNGAGNATLSLDEFATVGTAQAVVPAATLFPEDATTVVYNDQVSGVFPFSGETQVVAINLPAPFGTQTGPLTFFEFNGTAADAVTILLNGLNHKVFGPDGSEVGLPVATPGTPNIIALPTTGTYYVVAFNNVGTTLSPNPVEFDLSIYNGAAPVSFNQITQPTDANPIAYGQEIIGYTPEDVLFTFLAEDGDEIDADFTFTDGNFTPRLYDGSWNLLDSNDPLLYNVPNGGAGIYYIVLERTTDLGRGYVFELDEDATQGQPNQQYTIGLNTTIAAAGFVIDVPQIYPNDEDVYSTTPIFTWPAIDDVSWYEFATLLPATGEVTWYSFGPSENTSLEGEDYAGICANGQCRVRPNEQIAFFMDTEVEFYVRAYGSEGAGFPYLFDEETDFDGWRKISDFTVVAPQITVSNDQNESNSFEGRPYFAVRQQSDGGLGSPVPVMVEDMYGVLRPFNPNYHRIFIAGDNGDISDQWWQGTTGLAVYDDQQDTLFNGNYVFYAQSYDILHDAFTVFSAPDSFEVSETAPDSNDFLLDGIYESLGPNGNDSVYDLNTGGLTATWLPCGEDTDGKSECMTSRPFFHFIPDVDDYSGDWLGVLIEDSEGGVVFSSWFNRYTWEKFEFDQIIPEPVDYSLFDQFDTSYDMPVGPYQQNSFWYCGTGIGGVGAETCVVQPRGLDAFLMNGADYTVSFAGFHIGGFSGYTEPGDLRTDPNQISEFGIAGEKAPSGLMVDVVGAPLTSTYDDRPHYLTETLISGEPKISWEHVPDATWYEIVIAGPGGIVYDEWVQPNVEEIFGDYTTWPGISDGWGNVWDVNNQNPIASETTEGLWCRANDTSDDSPDPLDIFGEPWLDKDGNDDTVNDYMDLGDTVDMFTFVGVRGQDVNINVTTGGSELDPLLTLYGPNGDVIAEDDDASMTEGNAQIVVTLPGTGIFQVAVGKAADTEGTYTLTKVVTNNFGLGSAGLLSGGSNDVFLQNLTAGTVIDLTLSSGSDDADLTFVLEMYDGTQVASVSVQDADPAADVTVDTETTEFVTVPETTTYRVVITNNGTTDANYTASIAAITVNFTGVGIAGVEFTGVGIAGAGYDANGLQQDGETTRTFAALAGEALDIKFEVTAGNVDLVAEVVAPDGTVIASNDDWGEVLGDPSTNGLPFLRMVELPVDGLYRLVVTNKSFVGGTFNIDLVPKRDIEGDGFFDGYCGFTINENELFDSFIGGNGSYTAYVRYYNGGLSEFAEADFTVDNAAAQAPEVADGVLNVYNAENLTGTTRPIFQWNHIDGNTWYAVNVTGPDGFEFASEFVRAADICDYEFLNDGDDPLDFSEDDVLRIMCDLELNYEDDTFVPFTLAGDYQWTVTAFSPENLGAVDTSSTPATFTVAGIETTAPAPIWPPASLTDTEIVTLTYTNRLPVIFEPSNNAAWYFIYIGRVEEAGGSTTYFAPTIADWYYLPLDNTQKDQFPQDTYAEGNWDQTFQNEYDQVCYVAEEASFDFTVDLDTTDTSGSFEDSGAVPSSFLGLDAFLLNEDIAAGATEDYTFNGMPGHQVNVFASSTQVDVSIELIDPDGNVVASDDDGGSGTNSQLWQVVLEKEGVYSVVVTNKDGAIDATDVFVQVNTTINGIYFNNLGTRFYTGKMADGTNTYIYLLEGEEYCYFSPLVEYVDEKGEEQSHAVEFLENGTYEWWMGVFGPNGFIDNEFGGFVPFGQFNLEIPAPDPLFNIFEPVYGELAAKSSDTHTVYIPAGENLDLDVQNMGFADNASRLEVEVFAPGDVRGEDNAVSVFTLGGGTTSNGTNVFAGMGGIYTIVVTNQDALDVALYSLMISPIGSNVYANTETVQNWFSPELVNGAANGDGTVVDGRLTTISFDPGGANRYSSYNSSVNSDGAAAQWYKVEIIDTSNGETIFDEWISREDALCDFFERPVSNYYDECQILVPGDLFNPFGVFEIKIAVWGQGYDGDGGAPYFGAVLPMDHPDTSINEGAPLVFTKL